MKNLEKHQIGVCDLLASIKRSSARDIRPLQVSFDSFKTMSSVTLLVFRIVDFRVVREDRRDGKGSPYLVISIYFILERKLSYSQ